MMAGREPMAFAKIASRHDVVGPFYLTENHVKEWDLQGNPIKIEAVLGRSPPERTGPLDKPDPMFDADFHIGHKMKISRRHAMIYWSHERQQFELKSICKNAVRVNGTTFHGSADGNGAPAKLESQSVIEIADGERLYFLLPKAKCVQPEKPRLTHEQLVISVLEPDKQLSFCEIIEEIQSRHRYYVEPEVSSKLKKSLRTMLSTKSHVFQRLSAADGKKVTCWMLRRAAPEHPSDPSAAAAAAEGGGGGDSGAAAGDDHNVLESEGGGDGRIDMDGIEPGGGGGGDGATGGVIVVEDSPMGGPGGGAADPGKADGMWSSAA